MPEVGESCVYRLIDDDNEVVYVGQTDNLSQRLMAHLSSEKEFSDFSYVVVEPDMKNETEAIASVRDGVVHVAVKMVGEV